jgi:hypothetical protein
MTPPAPRRGRSGAAVPSGATLARHVRIRKQKRASRVETIVDIDHLLPADEEATDGWRITTKEQFLPAAHFDAAVRDTVKCASQERGRRLHCIDRATVQVVATISYHLDDNARFPLLLTAIGIRIDGDQELQAQSRAAAAILKQYAHEIARRTGRGDHVDIDASPTAADDLARLGFRKAPNVRGLRVAGLHLRQGPLLG